MSKKAFMIPRIVMSGWGGDVIETGLGTAGDTPDVMVCSYVAWLVDYKSDINNDGLYNLDDYYLWFDSHGFTEEQWLQLNEGDQAAIDYWHNLHQQQP